MKTHILTLAAIAALTTLGLADSPDAILKDYRKQATQATQRLNETLEKQSAPIITDLLRKNDTAGAESVAAQVKAKLAGEAVATPHVSAAALFAQYDGARATALQPIQKATLKRLDSLLNVAGGPKAEELTELTKVRADIEAGRTNPLPKLPEEWTFRKTPNGGVSGTFYLKQDGSAELHSDVGINPAKWKTSKKNDGITVIFPNDTWIVTFNGPLAEIHSSVWKDTRYLVEVQKKQ